MLKYRLIFGPILVALLVGVFCADHWLATTDSFPNSFHCPKGVAIVLLAIVAVTMAAKELANFFQAKGIPISTGQVASASVLSLVTMTLVAWRCEKIGSFMRLGLSTNVERDLIPLSFLGVGLLAVLFLATMYRHAQKTRNPANAMAVGGAMLLSAVYLGVLTSFLLLIRIDFGIPAAIAIILITKSCDIGAYFTGRAIGKTKLIPWISPGKTREGLAGGVVFSALVAVGFQQWTLPASVLGGGQVLPLCCPLTAAVFGAALAVLGQGGDLLASMFKRDAGVKDSGSSLPGFGGVIDVLDSPIAIAPIAYGALKVLAYCSTSGCGGGTGG